MTLIVKGMINRVYSINFKFFRHYSMTEALELSTFYMHRGIKETCTVTTSSRRFCLRKVPVTVQEDVEDNKI